MEGNWRCCGASIPPLVLTLWSGEFERGLLLGGLSAESGLDELEESELVPLRYPFSDGRSSVCCGGLVRALMPKVLADVRGVGGEPLPFTAVKVGVKESTTLSLSMYVFGALSSGKWTTADILCYVGASASMERVAWVVLLRHVRPLSGFCDNSLHLGRIDYFFQKVHQ
jgi:hypothetical protein